MTPGMMNSTSPADRSLADQVAQMVIVRASGHLFDHQIEYPAWEPSAQQLQRWLQLGVGGVILLGGTAAEVGLRTQQLQDWAKFPLLIAADIEEGVGQRFVGAVWFPPPMAIGAIAQTNLSSALDYAEQMGATTAQEALAIGINWILAPVVDVNNNPANPVINVRAWGETPERVSQLTTAFIRGAQQYPVLTTAKHFPGHGDTAVDSHLTLPLLEHDAARLSQIELPPFQAAIAAGVDAVMTAHVQLKAWDARPATLSRPILTGLLRQSLQFEGLIVTDALVMGAITQQFGANEAAVLAVEAGADVLMMPLNPEGAIQAICDAVEQGRIPLSQIQTSVARIWQAKQKVQPELPAGGIAHDWEICPPSPIQLNQLAQPATLDTVEAILQDSLVLYQPLVSAAKPGTATQRNLILLDDLLNCAFLNRQAPAITLPAELGYTLQIVDGNQPEPNWNPTCPTLLQLFIRGNPFRNSAALLKSAQTCLAQLVCQQQLQAVVIYGSPYALEQLKPLLSSEIPYVFSYGQFAAAQKVALHALLTALKPTGDAVTAQPAAFTD